MLETFLLLLLFSALVVIAFSVGLVWLLLGHDREEKAGAERAPSISQALMRDWEARRVWRALSGWMTTKPLRIEDRRDLEG